MENLDEIIPANPTGYECVVWKYQIGLGEMLIKVSNYDGSSAIKTFHLFLQNVMYFEGPLKWKSVAFYSGSGDECIAILNKIGFEQAELAVSANYYKLYKIDLPNFEVKIVAVNIFRVDDLAFSTDGRLLEN